MAKQCTQAYTLLDLSLDNLRTMLRYLLRSPNPLILPHKTSTPPSHYCNTSSQILQVSSLFYHLGLPILYGENTFTTSPTTSYHFDTYLATLPRKNRQLITSVVLQIDWAEKLWSKFPLVAKALGELPLRRLVIAIVRKNDERSLEQEQRSALREKERQGGGRPGRRDEIGKRGGLEREGAMKDVMPEVEKKMLRDLVRGLRTLREFRLDGYVDEGFARRLERLINDIRN